MKAKPSTEQDRGAIIPVDRLQATQRLWAVLGAESTEYLGYLADAIESRHRGEPDVDEEPDVEQGPRLIFHDAPEPAERWGA